MNVNVFEVKRTAVRDFTSSETREHSIKPFVAVLVVDGKGSEVKFLLRSSGDAFRLMEAAREAMELLGVSEVAPEDVEYLDDILS